MTRRHLAYASAVAAQLAAVTPIAAAQAAHAESCEPTPPPVNKVDVLFVVDNSNSMAGEQAALREQFPDMVESLTTGIRYPGDPQPFRPVSDLHLGVVSTDMGIPGVELPPSCHADGGDDGRLQHLPVSLPDMTCDTDYPAYLSYDPSQDPQALADDFACIATLGTGGCGFEQPLESMFKALMPKYEVDGNGVSPYRFISITEAGTWGRGDAPAAEGGNLGFLRNDPDDPSLIVVVVVTDEEDCSVKSTDHLKPNNQLPEDSPYRAEDINLRCFYHPEYLYDLQARYLDGLRALRPGREDLVMFTVIAGVPPDLVDRDALAATDFAMADSRAQFYDAILQDPRMREEVDPTTTPGSGQGNLVPSCARAVAGEITPSTAYPPRRLVQLARDFGEHGMVQSLCQGDLETPVAAIVDAIARHL